jgi:hypothetical protein
MILPSISAVEKNANENKFSLLLTRAQTTKEARELAIVASGIVQVSCRIVNEASTYVLYCGEADVTDELEPERQRLLNLGFSDIVIMETNVSKEVILENFEPILLGAEDQEYLIKMAQTKLLFTSKSTKSLGLTKKAVDVSLNAELVRQGKYFIDRGWAAYENNDYDMSVGLFNLAAKINQTRLDANYGLALNYIQLKNVIKLFRF